MFNGVLYRLNTEIPWKDLSESVWAIAKCILRISDINKSGRMEICPQGVDRKALGEEMSLMLC